MDHWKPLLLTIVLLGSPSSHAEPQASVDGQRFAEGMTVMFPGKQALHFRLRSDPLPDAEQSGPVTELQLCPPLDLWILGADGNRLSVEDARLLGPDGLPVPADPPGHWRVERSMTGYYDLDVRGPTVPWRLWSAFHPFMLRLNAPVTIQVDSPPATVYLFPAQTRLDLVAAGPTVIGDDEKATWLAFLQWDLFEPSRPDIRIEGKTVLAPGEQLALKAIVVDPDQDVERITWHLPDGQTHDSPEFHQEALHFQPWTLKVTAQDRNGTTAELETEIRPPPLHTAEPPGLVMIQAEDFTDQGEGRVTGADHGSNAEKMITKWHHEPEHWLEWSVDIQQAGAYDLYARYATGGSETRLTLTIDGTSPGDAYTRIAFPVTGGYGRKETEWRTLRLGPLVKLAAGAHTLRLKNLGAGLALDYLALVPVREESE